MSDPDEPDAPDDAAADSSDTNEPPFGNDTWDEIGMMETEAEENPQAFEDFQQEVADATDREYPDGDGEV